MFEKKTGDGPVPVFQYGDQPGQSSNQTDSEEKTGYDRNSIDAFCMGEHGDSQMVPLSRVSIGGKPFLKLQKEHPDTLGKITLEELQEEVRQAGTTVIEGKGSTEFGIGIALSEIVSAVFHDENESGLCQSVWKENMGRKMLPQEFRL